MITIKYLQAGELIGTVTNGTYAPNVGDKLSIKGLKYKVKDKIFMVESNTLYVDIVESLL